ncbi:hypothetical protein ONZ45_g9663 [Pleurotus djamor]|nr:hypothetical protein ONZ45_g9663 [Pleurotus djamor]
MVGDIVHVTIFGRHVVLVNSLSIANDLFEKRSRLYSDRPELTMLTMMGWGFNLAFMHHDDPRWKRHRKVFQRFFGPYSPLAIKPIQEKQVQHFLRALTDSPHQFAHHARNYAASIIMHAVCGNDIMQKNKYLVKLACDAVDTLSEEVLFGAQALFAFPSLKYIPSWFPGGGFKKLAIETRKVTSTLQNIPVDLVKQNMARSMAPCLATELLELSEPKEEDTIDESDIKALTATAFAGGIHTVESPLTSFFLAMVLYPVVQKRAQQELDTVIGPGRLPVFQDQASLPYINAVCVSHSVVNDDEYNGYYIPKDTAVLSNIWAISRDERMFHDPNTFIPERFLKADGSLSDLDSSFVFGFGRRICPGRYMAEATIFLAVANILSVFDVTKAKDIFGNDVVVEEKYSSTGLITSVLHSFDGV